MYRIFIELMTSDRKIKASRESSKGRNVKGLESETRSLSVEGSNRKRVLAMKVTTQHDPY